jgi:hypothetical protein
MLESKGIAGRIETIENLSASVVVMMSLSGDPLVIVSSSTVRQHLAPWLNQIHWCHRQCHNWIIRTHRDMGGTIVLEEKSYDGKQQKQQETWDRVKKQEMQHEPWHPIQNEDAVRNLRRNQNTAEYVKPWLNHVDCRELSCCDKALRWLKLFRFLLLCRDCPQIRSVEKADPGRLTWP